MKYVRRSVSLLFLFLFLFSECSTKNNSSQQLSDFFSKEDVTILVTDSGLGGLSVAADLAARLPESGVFKKVNIIFFNALFHNRSGYNSLQDEEEKIRIFNAALDAMTKKYRPDLLLIACNTLSVLYDKTPFSQNAKIPVIGIVETGVDLIARQFDKNPKATAIIFATKTTIGSNSHKNKLVEKGYPAEQIIGEPCHRLAGAIERGYDSDETVFYISLYVKEALEQLPQPNTPIFASLNCTHYGYSIQQFKEAFASEGHADIIILDPNPEMADFIFKSQYLHRFPENSVNTTVVSKVKISQQKRNSLGSLLKNTSPAAAEALENYQYDWDLFDSKFDSTRIEE